MPEKIEVEMYVGYKNGTWGRNIVSIPGRTLRVNIETTAMDLCRKDLEANDIDVDKSVSFIGILHHP